MHTITQEEIIYAAKELQDFANIYQEKPGEFVQKGILRVLDQVEQSIAPGWVEFIDMGALARDWI